MPGYRIHMMASSACGAALTGIAFLSGKADLVSSLMAGGLCSIGGLVPDIDSKTSSSFRQCMVVVAGFASLLLVSRLRDFPMDSEMVAIIGGGNFILAWTLFGGLIKKLTVHRGMCHSIPMVFLTGEIIFLLSSGDASHRFFNASAIMLGVLIHLILDEVYSVQLKSSRSGGIKIKKSLGSALKFINFNDMKGTIAFFTVLAIVSYVTIREPVWGEDLERELDKDDWTTRQMMTYVETKKPEIFDLYVIKWVAQNDLILRPATPDNQKWEELRKLFDDSEGKNGTTPSNETAQKKKKNFNVLDVISYQNNR